MEHIEMSKIFLWGSFIVGFLNPIFFIPFGLYLLADLMGIMNNRDNEISQQVIQFPNSFTVNIFEISELTKKVLINSTDGVDVNKIYVEPGRLGNDDIEIRDIKFVDNNQLQFFMNLARGVIVNFITVYKITSNGNYELRINYDDGK
jgi:uncharacterized protein YecE (DUF72 family)